MSHALIVAAEKSLAQPGGAERAVLELCLALRSGFGDAVHQALRLVAPLYLECGDNGLRQAIVASLASVDAVFAPETDLLAPFVLVLESNDPVARGLTLKALGHLAPLIVELDDVHFRVLERLESEHPVEQEGALFCARRLVALSEDVARSVLRKIPDLFAGESVGDRFKLGLIRVLAHVPHSSVAVCTEARRQAVMIMQSMPMEDFVVASLEALTRTAVDSHVFTEPQLDILWSTLLEDPRPRIRLACLRGMIALARVSPLEGEFRPEMVLALMAKEQSSALKAAFAALIAHLSPYWLVSGCVYETDKLASLLRNTDDERTRLWSLRALSGAVSASAKSAVQLYEYVAHVCASGSQNFFVKRGPLFTAALSLCHARVRAHSPKLGEQTIFVLLGACGSTANTAMYAILHAVSCGAGHVVFSDVNVFWQKLQSMAQELVASSDELAADCFCAVAIAFLRTLPLLERGQQQIAQDFGSFGPLVKHAAVRASQSGPWSWTCYRLAKEAVIGGFVAPAGPIFGRLAQDPLPESSRVRNWLFFLAEWCRAEAEAQVGNVIEASIAMRRANVFLVASCPPAVRQLTQASIPTNSRSQEMTFVRRFCAWKLGLVEGSSGRPDRWTSLGEEALALSHGFPDMTTDASCIKFLRDCAHCCFAIGGKEGPTKAEHSVLDQQSFVSQLKASIKEQSAADIKEALLVASSLLPRYFFRTEPSMRVELSFFKPKAPDDSAALLYSAETGHVVSIDGKIHRPTRSRSYTSVELNVKVVWSSEKASIVARQLAGDGQLRKGSRTVMDRTYRSKVIGDAFSTMAMIQMPLEPRHGHVVLIHVNLVDAFGDRWENVCAETFVATSLE